jgi:hypothetical protein
VTLTGGNVETYLWGNQLKDSINLGEYSPELDNNGIYILPASGEYEMALLHKPISKGLFHNIILK